ncbi:MAG: glycosyltransferase family 2 protein [Phycisphaerales bacterium]|nr:glycosyltransferase family 2 protein [Planctomycetota bacterium]MCH8509279.1 glycosyltransferase family 2 protein [Phycisphaerales bacterium]
MKLAVVIPVYNERALLPRLFQRLMSVPPPHTPRGMPCERVVILVDDGSTDGSRDVVQALADKHPGVVAVLAPTNRGKGAALRLGLDKALELGARVAIIQDADLEYDPGDQAAVLAPILDGRADAVIGTRFLGQTHRVLYYWHQLANRVITIFSNMLSNLNLTDIECGYKAFSRPVLERLRLTEDRFGVEPEIVAKLARMRLPEGAEGAGVAGEAGGEGEGPSAGRSRAIRIYEVPVSYAGRTYAEGKKIGWKDGVAAMWCILRHNLF